MVSEKMQERFDNFNVEGITSKTEVYLTRVADPFEYELSVRATNILMKVDLPQGVTTVEELFACHRWISLRVIREYIEEGILKKVSPKPKSIKDVNKIRTFFRRLGKLFMKIYFPVLPV